MDDSFIKEDIDFFNAGNGVHPQPLQRALQPLVIRCGGLVHGFFLPEEDKNPQSFSKEHTISALTIASPRELSA